MQITIMSEGGNITLNGIRPEDISLDTERFDTDIDFNLSHHEHVSWALSDIGVDSSRDHPNTGTIHEPLEEVEKHVSFEELEVLLRKARRETEIKVYSTILNLGLSKEGPYIMGYCKGVRDELMKEDAEDNGIT